MRRAFTIIESLVTLAALFVLTMLLLSLIKHHTSPAGLEPAAKSNASALKMENAKTAPLTSLPEVREPARAQP
jgi:hypothetical protein